MLFFFILKVEDYKTKKTQENDKLSKKPKDLISHKRLFILKRIFMSQNYILIPKRNRSLLLWKRKKKNVTVIKIIRG